MHFFLHDINSQCCIYEPLARWNVLSECCEGGVIFLPEIRLSPLEPPNPSLY